MSAPYDAVLTLLARWRTNALAFVRECLHAEPDPGQAQALEAAHHTQRLAAMASKGTGKTTLASWLMWWFLATRPNARIAATSVSEDALNDTLWPELALWQARSPFLQQHFVWTKTRIVAKEAPETWFATARSWPKHADTQRQAETLQGLHADHIMFVLDESGSIPQAVMATAEAVLASGVDTKIVQLGNPTSLDGPLYRACVTDRHLWTVITMTGDPDDPNRSPRVSLEWAREQIRTYGRDNPWVQVNVLGKFPPASLNALLGPEDVLAAMKRQLDRHAFEWSQKRIGVDVARFGDDRTCLAPRQGLMWMKPRVMRHDRGSAVSTDIAAAVMRGKAKWGAGDDVVILVDGTGGWGAGAVDVLRTGGESPLDVQFHAPASDPRFANRRAEMWWAMAEAVKSGAALPNEPELVGELTAVTYTFHNGRFLLEPKDQVKARLGRSPDLADAFAITYALPDMPAAMAHGIGRGNVGKCLTEYDPHAPDQEAERRRARQAAGW